MGKLEASVNKNYNPETRGSYPYIISVHGNAIQLSEIENSEAFEKAVSGEVPAARILDGDGENLRLIVNPRRIIRSLVHLSKEIGIEDPKLFASVIGGLNERNRVSYELACDEYTLLKEEEPHNLFVNYSDDLQHANAYLGKVNSWSRVKYPHCLTIAAEEKVLRKIESSWAYKFMSQDDEVSFGRRGDNVLEINMKPGAAEKFLFLLNREVSLYVVNMGEFLAQNEQLEQTSKASVGISA